MSEIKPSAVKNFNIISKCLGVWSIFVGVVMLGVGTYLHIRGIQQPPGIILIICGAINIIFGLLIDIFFCKLLVTLFRSLIKIIVK